MKTRKNLFFLFVLGSNIFSNAIFADSTFNIAPGIMNFHYEETGVDGSFLDGEYGDIPGVQLSIKRMDQESLFSVALALEYYAGNVDYTGFVQSTDTRYDGLPLSTTTDQNVLSLSATIEKSFIHSPYLSIYGKLTYKNWDRDIQGKYISGIDNFGNPFTNVYVSGLHEVYKWWQLTFGFSAKFSPFKNSDVDFRAGLIRTIHPRMDVAAYTYDLQEAWGHEVEFSYYYTVRKNNRVGISGSVMVWSFGRSNEVAGYVEPDSESEMKTIQMLYEIKW